MSGPIVRTGPTPAFSQNWERIFAKKKASKSPAVTAKKAGAKSAKKKSGKKK